MTRALAFLLLSPTLLWNALCVSAAAQDSFRVATWNIKWCFDHRVGDNNAQLARDNSAPNATAWRWRVEHLAEAIQALAADVIALQEIEDGDAALEIADQLESLGLSYEVAFVQGTDSFTEQDVVFLVRSNIDFLCRRLLFENAPNEAFKDLSKHQCLTLQLGGRPLSLINVHLITRSNQRLRQARTLRGWLDEFAPDSRVIVLGDTNVSLRYEQTFAESDIGLIRGLQTPSTGDDLFDLHEELAPTSRGTFRDGKHLDRILLSSSIASGDGLTFRSIVNRRDVVVRGARIDRADWSIDDDERDLSDHYPLVATFDVHNARPKTRLRLARSTHPDRGPQSPLPTMAPQLESPFTRGNRVVVDKTTASEFQRSILAGTEEHHEPEPPDTEPGNTTAPSNPADSADLQIENRLLCLQTFPDRMLARIETRDRLLSQSLPTRLGGTSLDSVIRVSKTWLPGSTVTVAFRGGSYELRRMIAETARGWTDHGNLTLDFGHIEDEQTFREWTVDDSMFSADIRIGFTERGYWSLIGNDSRNPALVKPWQASMNFERFHLSPPSGWRGVVLHEFGHALGFEHEHQHSREGCNQEFRWDDDEGYSPTRNSDGEFIADDDGNRPGIYTVLAGPPNEWPKWKVDHNLRQLEPSGDLDENGFDDHSIMLYAFPDWMFLSGQNSPCFVGFEAQTLSVGDQSAFEQIYPDGSSAIATAVAIRNRYATKLSDLQRDISDERARLSVRQVYSGLAVNPLTYTTFESAPTTREVTSTVMAPVTEEKTSKYTVMVPRTEEVEVPYTVQKNGQEETRTKTVTVTKQVPETRTRTYNVTKQRPFQETREVTVMTRVPRVKAFEVLDLATDILAKDPTLSKDNLKSQILRQVGKSADQTAEQFVSNELKWLLGPSLGDNSVTMRRDLTYSSVPPLPIAAFNAHEDPVTSPAEGADAGD